MKKDDGKRMQKRHEILYYPLYTMIQKFKFTECERERKGEREIKRERQGWR